MKKLLSYLAAICLSCVILTACGGKSWNQERAQELCDKQFEQLTAEDFDEMLALLEGGWEDVYKPALKAEDPKSSSGLSDEDYDFLKVYQKLGRRVSSMATATKRVVSDSQSKQAEELQKRINEELRQLFEQKNKN